MGLMANDKCLEELRREGYIAEVCERRLNSFITKDLFGCADVIGHWPDCDRRDRLVNSCGPDVQPHIDKFLKGWKQEIIRKNPETGLSEIRYKDYPPNPYLPTLLLKYEFFLYSFILRKDRKKDGSMAKDSHYICRKWQALLSPQGSISFERIENE